jgi:hypothetical protein
MLMTYPKFMLMTYPKFRGRDEGNNDRGPDHGLGLGYSLTPAR